MERALIQITTNRAPIPESSGSPIAYQTYLKGRLFHRGFTINAPAIHNPRHLDGIEQSLVATHRCGVNSQAALKALPVGQHGHGYRQ